MTFGNAIGTCLGKYADFSGRASRSEFWYFYLFQVLIGAVTGLGLVLANVDRNVSTLITAFVSLSLLWPSLAVAARRLHDTGRSGWLQLLHCIPVVGSIILLVLWMLEGTAGPNRFGEPEGAFGNACPPQYPPNSYASPEPGNIADPQQAQPAGSTPASALSPRPMPHRTPQPPSGVAWFLSMVAAGIIGAALVIGFGKLTSHPPSSPSPGAPRPQSTPPPKPPPPAQYTNSIGMEFVKVPSGSYMRGCNSNFENCDSDETPQRRISISSFWIGKYEVTQEQWVAVMGNNPSKFKGRTNPVEMVSWHDAQEFVRRLNAKEGHNRYRLPTEAEWEYAARAGSETAYSFGGDAGELGAYAWYWDNSGYKTHPVGQKNPNAWGLYDMHGNVWEWCSDWFDSSYYRSGSVTDPRGPSSGEYRVLRGGCWGNNARLCRSANRSDRGPDYRHDYLGFRLALSPGH